MNRFKRHWQIFAVVLIFFLSVGALLLLSLKHTDGHLIYFADDPYIHMALAKNFVKHGVWGVTRYEFSSSSSSPLWTLLLAGAYYLFGINEVAPFALNLIIGLFLILCAYALFRGFEPNPTFLFLTLLAILFLAPIPVLVFFGQEHVLQILIDVLFVYLFAKLVSAEKPSLKGFIPLFILTPFVTAVRYEGIFLVFVACVLFAVRGRFLHALFLGAMGALPIAIYGVISLSKGWYFLPNPVLLKGYIPKPFSLDGIVELAHYYDEVLMKSYHICFLIIAALVALVVQNSILDERRKSAVPMIALFVATSLLHLQFARASIRAIRYDAYLVVLGIFSICALLSQYFARDRSMRIASDSLPRFLAIAVFALLVAFPLVWRSVRAFHNTPKATKNIYEQQYQMGLFLKKFYQGASVAVNDIGAVNFLADIKCLDLWGLADLEVAKLKREGKYDAQKIQELALKRGVKIAIVYEHWFPSLPDEWIKVGQWTVSDNVVLGGDTVAFFATDESGAEDLVVNLREFSKYLPKAVKQAGMYAHE